MVKEPEFRFGPLSKGAFIAMMCITPVVPLLNRDWFLPYLLILVFLGFALRPVLVRTGLYELWNRCESGFYERWDRKFLHKRRMDIERKARDEKLRKSRYRDPRLPKNW